MPALYVVATPIGNLSELSPRAADALRGADLILAEDTRVTSKLLAHIGTKVPMQSNHRHNEREQAAAIVNKMLERDMTVALVSDAGTPGVSDPGAALVDAAREAGIPVYPVAGPSAIAAALSVCGFHGPEYAFLGFPPRQAGDRDRFLEGAAALGLPVVVLFESPHRVQDLVRAIGQRLPAARLCACCDLTKKFERITRGSPPDVLRDIEENPNAAKGEYVLVLDLSGCEAPQEKAVLPSVRAFLLERMLEGDSPQEGVAAAMEAGYPRNGAYKAMLDIRSLYLAAQNEAEGPK